MAIDRGSNCSIGLFDHVARNKFSFARVLFASGSGWRGCKNYTMR
jgi:hypothetical protein